MIIDTQEETTRRKTETKLYFMSLSLLKSIIGNETASVISVLIGSCMKALI